MIFKGSRFTGATVMLDKDKGEPYLEFADTSITPSAEDVVYQFIEGDRLDLLAEKYLGSANYKWAILYANPQYLTEYDILNGDYITIPSVRRVMEIVNGS